ncbi:somatomedin-B and thrombospondin type-1 domain-containing protein-like [Eublepharis macularius]|uniref:Somatomedin-B and thrombospondin type-1 domain-containing protein-like n=1 Tax=Eublepharis macularius TaxID=481883 RepID=A0AA97JBD4_EUBMA|nr:somatomedin-B and thrombospondin type-1 domain-containing protein-like [Eublepharis macularius]
MPARPSWALAVGLWLLAAPGAESGCAELGQCCAGRSLACVSSGWRPDGSHGPCYCDQACPYTLDCCHDYRQACPELSCVVSEWSQWSGCAEPCKATYRVRRRRVIQEPRNSGGACPPLEEKAGCLEYWNQQGKECKQSFIPALITTGGYGKARKKRAASNDNERAGYCVEFQLLAITEGCLQGNSSYTHWMKYLSEGHTVCVECQHPALDSRSLHCSGDGSGAKKNQRLHWQAVGNPRCRGTWARVRQLDTCSCPSVHSFLFI